MCSDQRFAEAGSCRPEQRGAQERTILSNSDNTCAYFHDSSSIQYHSIVQKEDEFLRITVAQPPSARPGNPLPTDPDHLDRASTSLVKTNTAYPSSLIALRPDRPPTTHRSTGSATDRWTQQYSLYNRRSTYCTSRLSSFPRLHRERARVSGREYKQATVSCLQHIVVSKRSKHT